MIPIIGIATAFLYCLERCLKYVAVLWFFRRRDPTPEHRPRLISVLQPVLSGDPKLAEVLGHNLFIAKQLATEFIWLIDDDDELASQICEQLINQHTHTLIRLIRVQRGGPRQSPKMIKLQRGLEVAQGDVIAVLDDDTMLPEAGLDGCLGWLEAENVGLVFGLPYYVAFDSLAASLVSCFVNSNSLLTYVPYTLMTDPFTINGMFYVMRRDRVDDVGGFDGLESVLADDFAVAQHFRKHNYRLVQSRLRHAIYTNVKSWPDYLRLLRRWLVFPRETLMRDMTLSNLAIAYSLALIPCLLPIVVLACAVASGAASVWIAFACCVAINFVVFVHLDSRFLGGATPVRCFWLVPVLQLLVPLQLIAALFLPQRIVWRGHVMQVEPGGTFEIVQCRQQPSPNEGSPPSSEAMR